MAIGSRLGSSLAYILMCNFENKWLKGCPHGVKPVFRRRYVNDLFLLFSMLDHAKKFENYLSFKHGQRKERMVVYLF